MPRDARLTARGRAVFDGRAMPQPSHIYSSTLHRRRRRWRRRRSLIPPLLAVLALAAIAGVLVLAVL